MLDVSLGEMPPCDAGKRANGGGAKLYIGLEGEASGAQTSLRSQQPPQASSISNVSHIGVLSANHAENNCGHNSHSACSLLGAVQAYLGQTLQNEEKHAWLDRSLLAKGLNLA